MIKPISDPPVHKDVINDEDIGPVKGKTKFELLKEKWSAFAWKDVKLDHSFIFSQGDLKVISEQDVSDLKRWLLGERKWRFNSETKTCCRAITGYDIDNRIHVFT